MSGLNTREILDRIISHAMRLGHFDKVAGHEPKRAPGNGLTAAVWVDRIEAAGEVSGLASASVRIVVSVRVYGPMLAEPQDDIDPNMADAVDALMNAFAGNFSLLMNWDLPGDQPVIRNIDIFGETGPGLSAQAGYLEQDHKLYRVMTINVPMIVNDVWTLAEGS